MDVILKSPKVSLDDVVQLVGASSHTPEGWGFDSQSGHIPRLQVLSPVGYIWRQSINVNISLSLSLSPLVSL